MGKTFFHITTGSNWEKIKNEGLIPQVGNRCKEIGETIPSIFLFENKGTALFALHDWLLVELLKESNEVVLLEIILENGFRLDEDCSCEYAVRSYSKIPPEKIYFVKKMIFPKKKSA